MEMFFFGHVSHAPLIVRAAKIMIDALPAKVHSSCISKNALSNAYTHISEIKSIMNALSLANQFSTLEIMQQAFAFLNVKLLYMET